jgi:hypothetical protein
MVTPASLTYSGTIPPDPNILPTRTQGMCWQHGGYDAGDVLQKKESKAVIAPTEPLEPVPPPPPPPPPEPHDELKLPTDHTGKPVRSTVKETLELLAPQHGGSSCYRQRAS